MRRTCEAWRKLGEAALAAYEAVNVAARDRLRDRDPAAYDALLIDFHSKNAAALPSSDRHFVPNLASGRPSAVETAIAFLEADAWFFRSGYEKKLIIRHLKRSAALCEDQRERLRRVVLAAIDHRDFNEFRAYCQLACSVWNDALDDAVADRMQSADPGVRRRATWVGEAALAAGKA